MKYVLALMVLLSSEIALGKTIRQQLDDIHKLMLVIAQAESGMKQINSKSGDDLGVFQIHKNEITHRKLDKKRLQTDLLYQYGVALMIMADKKHSVCKGMDTYYACYNSKTPKKHKVYLKKLHGSADYLKINLEEVSK